MLKRQPVGMCCMMQGAQTLVLCDNLEGWGGEGGGREVQEGGDIYIPLADSIGSGFPHSSVGRRICLQCRRPGFNSWVGKIPGEGNGDPLQYSCLENPTDRGTWRATAHGVAKSQARLNN